MGPELAAALVALQAELKPIARTAEGQAGTRKHTYSDLAAVSEAVYPLLGKHGLAFTAKPTLNAEGKFVLAYALLHKSGEDAAGEWPLHGGTPQQAGSEITYARRYCLCAVTGAVSVGEDDDGAAAGRAPRGAAAGRRPPARPAADTTRARTTGPDHERLRHGTVMPTPDTRRAERGPLPPERDHWDGQPAGTPKPAGNGTPGMIAQHFKRLEVPERDERLALTAKLAGWAEGREITSTNDLTPGEAAHVLGQLAKLRDHDALMGLVVNGVTGGG
jgi:ERF superfamily